MTGLDVVAGGLAGVAAVAALAAAAALALLFRHARRLPSALPNERTLHEAPVCRVGGLSIAAGFVLALGFSGVPLPGGALAWAGLAAIAGVSLVDDWRGVPAPVRLAIHLAGAALVAAALPGVAGGFGLVAATLAIAWSANLYNFMDGSDGLAATMAVCGFSALAAGAWIGGAAPAPMFAVAAASLPLLAANAPPARMFMGDVGAVPLGFLAALFGIAGWGSGSWPAWFPLLVFLPFIIDATLTLGRRLIRGERVWEAHKSHFYQRLHQRGAGHRGTLVFFGTLIVGTGSSAVATLGANPAAGWWVFGAWTGGMVLLFAGIDYHWGKQGSEKQ
jgi:UDP-N-acetylmuramyl pentapeptide phosphotransferase/UDP-N-acetylglucosamine-1-phosphate transferase